MCVYGPVTYTHSVLVLPTFTIRISFANAKLNNSSPPNSKSQISVLPHILTVSNFIKSNFAAGFSVHESLPN